MGIDEFWKLIGDAHQRSQGDMDRKCELVQKTVESMSPGTAAAFSKHFDESMNRAYTWGLWGAAYVIRGGCGDDTFSDFRASLVSRGQTAFEKAVADPDSLASETYDEDAWFYEGFQYAVRKGVAVAISPHESTGVPVPDEPIGEPWEESVEVLKERYPLLWANYEKMWAAPSGVQIEKPKPWWRFW